ncbi:ATP-independent periplasmic protein-refolding chaperone [Enterobacteriaceae bacterium BIT-l23]|jgi:protein CpxP|uniref:ATP-independent periplasmic protein-refolding chaperone n=1 Tax=Jejubacter calystegiae TaxID=2579935 RepID=A0A4P8YQQ3_9ENTR|nr:ATP-independent periplasmic protein-refolding chaperone Spy [Jejubacter calystegiae]NUU65528.1 ATP-independent periplasmic protein-refolding chaperone [Enterobacteriaceae bacterium BIT-l23]QCT21042.1 ATP-independent periplasmic protein-refolding chaperone [Jejubacter calystegiae]
MRKLTAIIVASSLALGAANLAHAADTSTTSAKEDAVKMHHHKGPRGPHHMMMFKDLNLTDAQKQQVRDIMKAERQKMPRPNLDERRAMHNLVASDTFDRAKAEQMIEKGEKQNQQRMLSMMETQNKIYNVLTPEQKKQYNANFEKHLTKKQDRMNKAAAE